ncbi:MAG: membrane-binding protein [Bacteroidota bacterium]
MKKHLILFFAILTASIINAQKIKPKFEKEGKLVKATYFYDSGQIKQQGFFNAEKLHDKWVSYDISGKKTAIAYYENGIKTGTWLFLDNGKVKEVTYNSNKIIDVKKLKDSSLAVY